MRLLGTPVQLGLLPGRYFDRTGDILFLEFPRVEVPRVDRLREVGAEGREHRPLVLAEAIRPIPVDRAIDGVIPISQVIVDDDLAIAVAVEVNRLDARGRISGQLSSPLVAERRDIVAQ